MLSRAGVCAMHELARRRTWSARGTSARGRSEATRLVAVPAARRRSRCAGIVEAHAHARVPPRALQAEVEPLAKIGVRVRAQADVRVGSVDRAHDLDGAGVELAGDAGRRRCHLRLVAVRLAGTTAVRRSMRARGMWLPWRGYAGTRFSHAGARAAPAARPASEKAHHVLRARHPLGPHRAGRPGADAPGDRALARPAPAAEEARAARGRSPRSPPRCAWRRPSSSRSSCGWPTSSSSPSSVPARPQPRTAPHRMPRIDLAAADKAAPPAGAVAGAAARLLRRGGARHGRRADALYVTALRRRSS